MNKAPKTIDDIAQFNALDKEIERLAYEYFIELGFEPRLAKFRVKELQICIFRGYNNRAQILAAIKTARAAI